MRRLGPPSNMLPFLSLYFKKNPVFWPTNKSTKKENEKHSFADDAEYLP